MWATEKTIERCVHMSRTCWLYTWLWLSSFQSLMVSIFIFLLFWVFVFEIWVFREDISLLSEGLCLYLTGWNVLGARVVSSWIFAGLAVKINVFFFLIADLGFRFFGLLSYFFFICFQSPDFYCLFNIFFFLCNIFVLVSWNKIVIIYVVFYFSFFTLT